MRAPLALAVAVSMAAVSCGPTTGPSVLRVRVLVDAFGSWELPNQFFAPLLAAGQCARVTAQVRQGCSRFLP